MNCNLLVSSQYPFDIIITNISTPFNQNLIPSGSSGNIQWSGNMTFNVPGMGDVLFVDVSNNQEIRKEVNPFTGQNILLVRYQGLEACYLFDGDGQIKLDFDEIGDLTVSLVNEEAGNILLELKGKDLVVKSFIPTSLLITD